MKRFIFAVGLALSANLAFAQSPPHSPGMQPMPHMTAPPPGKFPSAPMGGPIVGNKKTHVYHLPGDPSLPGEKNRVVFKTVAEAVAAGYHAPGKGPKIAHPKMMPHKMAKPVMGHMPHPATPPPVPAPPRP